MDTIRTTPFPDAPELIVTVAGTNQNARDMTGNHDVLAKFAKRQGVKRVFVPDVVKAEGNLAENLDFDPNLINDVYIMNGVKSEGAILSRGQAICLATGDCPTVIMHTPEIPDMAVVAHAGRDPIMAGVITNMIEAFGTLKDYRRLRAFIVLAIGPEHFDHPIDHPRYGHQNKMLIKHIRSYYGDECVTDVCRGTIDLVALIRSQCSKYNMLQDLIRHDGRDTFSDRLPDSSPMWHSHRRGSTGRNLVFVRF